MRTIKLILIILIVGFSNPAFSQIRSELVHKIILKNSDTTFNSKENTVTINEEDYMYFEFSGATEEFLLKIYPNEKYLHYSYDIFTTSDYDITDSVFFINDEYYQTKINFKRITDNPRLSLKISVKTDESRVMITEQALYPVAKMEADFVSKPEEVFVGEETTIEIFTNLPENIILDNKWNQEDNYNYRVLRRTNKVFSSIVATKTGRLNFDLFLNLKRPVKNKNGEFVYRYGPMPVVLNAKESRLSFLNLDQTEIVFDESTRHEGIEVQMDYHSALEMQKTYRIEAQEKPGGALIAEIFTKNRLANNKVLCVLRTYNYHSQSDGFLYLKREDDPMFVTNFSIIPYTNITAIEILREGGNWQRTTTVYPGEEVFIRLIGQSLQKGRFTIPDLIVNPEDSVVNRDDLIEFKAKVPLDIRRQNLPILNHNENIGKNLTVREYSKFRTFDYIMIDYGDGPINLKDITGPEFHKSTIRDIIISFDRDIIDSDELYGKQNFKIDVRITGKRNEVFEVLNIPRVTVSPGSNSPRYNFYDQSDAVNRISLNQYLRRNTFELDDWVRIQLTFTPLSTQDVGRDDIKQIDIVVQKNYQFDIDVSFPAGLITKKFDGESDFGNLSGISMAMIAQLSFYHPDKIARFRPYKVGAGFIAINALNFSETANRDVGVVVIGSLYPTTRDTRMTFPLYFGGGYLLDEGEFFVLIGPGIRVRF